MCSSIVRPLLSSSKSISRVRVVVAATIQRVASGSTFMRKAYSQVVLLVARWNLVEAPIGTFFFSESIPVLAFFW
jgi:hypothetical protein